MRRIVIGGDVVEVSRGLGTLKNSSIARGDGKIEYLKTVTFVNLHTNCRKNYANNLSITAFKRRLEEPSISISPHKKKISSNNFNVTGSLRWILDLEKVFKPRWTNGTA
ncbi:hypothetical protein PV328_001224 [Microctonus aethiopoides]|uniref:Uncharacterized protein n=1 Tax=Microctonus aethiopoides TaxID=144406 RepID=A0AA39KX98_9HYME|nr:hypothetical protein PV328_001224 [Microctonus aethiopoides]